MNRTARRLVLLFLTAAGAWAVRRVLVERAERAARRRAWMTADSTPQGPFPLPAGPVLSDADAVRAAQAPAASSTAAAPTATPTPAPSSDAPEAPAASAPTGVEDEAPTAPGSASASPSADASAPGEAAVAPPQPASDEELRGAAAATAPEAATSGPAPAEEAARTPQVERATGDGDDEPAPLEQVRQRLAALNVDAPPTSSPGSGARTRRPRRTARWIGPREDGSCRDSYPVKVKLRSGLFHLPGMLMYDRTHADRCYRSAEDAVADGFEQASR